MRGGNPKENSGGSREQIRREGARERGEQERQLSVKRVNSYDSLELVLQLCYSSVTMVFTRRARRPWRGCRTRRHADNRQKTIDSRQQTTDCRQQTTDSRQQTPDSKQQTAIGHPGERECRREGAGLQTADNRQ
jgi:hypothetical protein